MPSSQDDSVVNSAAPMDTNASIDPMPRTADRPTVAIQPADHINPDSTGNQLAANITSRRPRKQPQPTRLTDLTDLKDQNSPSIDSNPENDFVFTCHQLGLSPQSAPSEITTSKSKGLRAMIGAAFKRLSV